MNDIKLERLASWASGTPSPPVTIECHITNLCNLHCQFCWLRIADPKTFKPEMSHERFVELVIESHELGVKEWRIIGGGEPLVRQKTAADMLHLIKHYGMYGILTTNGVLLNSSLIDQLIADQWDVVTFSLDGPDAETQDFLRGKSGAFDAAHQALISIRDRKQAAHSQLPGVRFHTVLCHYNVRKLEQLILYAAQVGAEQILLQPMTFYSPEMRQLGMTPEDEQFLQDSIDRLESLAQSHGVWNNFAHMREQKLIEKTTTMHEIIKEDIKNDPHEHPFLSIPCYEPWYLMLIRPDGLVTPCNKFDYAGDDGIKKQLSDIWYGPFFSEVRRTLASGTLLPICATCCVGGVLENRRIREQLKSLIETPQSVRKFHRIKKLLRPIRDFFIK